MLNLFLGLCVLACPLSMVAMMLMHRGRGGRRRDDGRE